MIPLPLDRAVLGCALAQITQLMQTHDSKTDQSDQRIEKSSKFRAPPGQKPTSPHPELTSGTAQRPDPRAPCVRNPSSRALQNAAERASPP
jgi:hypothetical protein